MALVPLFLALLGVPQSAASGAAPWYRRYRALRPRGAVSVRKATRLGLVAGVVYFCGTLYWLTDVMVAFGGISTPVGVVLNLMLVAYLALFPAAFAGTTVFLLNRLGQAGLLFAPAVWVTTELGRRYLFSGFPWVLLGYSLTDVLPVAQLASIAGVYGLSALVVLVNCAIAHAFVDWRRGSRVAAAVLATVLVIGVWGASRIRGGALVRQGQTVRIGLVQGNIRQEDKWNPALASAILDRYLVLSREAAAQGAQLIIWPESATPFFFEEDPAGGAAIRQLARETGAYLLVGSDQIERDKTPRYYNSAFLVRPDGEVAEVYRKIHLVPFGEYIPLKKLLFFAGPLVESVSDFSPGDQTVALPIGKQWASTAICYEVVYPDLIRAFVLAGSELLTTITNDAWYGRSSAPHQHFQQAAMRAIEQGRYLARAANTGVSGIVDPYGRVVRRTPIFEEQIVVDEVHYLSGRTIYGTVGDLFAYICVALTVAAGLAARVGARTRMRAPDGVPTWIRTR